MCKILKYHSGTLNMQFREHCFAHQKYYKKLIVLWKFLFILYTVRKRFSRDQTKSGKCVNIFYIKSNLNKEERTFHDLTLVNSNDISSFSNIATIQNSMIHWENWVSHATENAENQFAQFAIFVATSISQFCVESETDDRHALTNISNERDYKISKNSTSV